LGRLLLCPALVLLSVVLWRGRRPPAGELWRAGVITLGAVVARLVWGLWGPLHVNGQGPLWIRGGALDPAALINYGPGYFEIFGLVARLGAALLGAPPDRAVFAANVALSALSPALLYTVARLAGVGRGGALAVAVALAADAVSVRTAATEGYFSSIVVLALAVQASLVLGAQAQVRGDRLAAGFCLAAAALLTGAAARIHPIAYLPLALCPLVVFGAARPEDWRARSVLTLVAAAAIGLSMVVSNGSTMMAAVRESPVVGHAFGGLTWRDGAFLVAALVATWVLRSWLRPPGLPVLGVGSLVLMLLTRDAFRQHPLWQLCYERLFWPGVLLGVAPLLPRRMQGAGWALGIGAGMAAGLLVPALPYVATATTEQLEYRFLQEVLPGMPPGCMLVGVSRAGKRRWEIPSYLLPSRRPGEAAYRNLEGPEDLHDAVESGTCLVYVRSSLCSSAEGRALCEQLEREPRLARVASRVFPAQPSYVDLPYDRSEVEVVVFRVRGGEVTTDQGRRLVGDGAAITPAFAQALYERLTPLRESDGCRVVRLDTSRFRIAIGVQSPSGGEQVLEVSTAADASGGARVAGVWTLAVPATIERECAVTLAAAERILSGLRAPGQ
jgi:hypothetical protein